MSDHRLRALVIAALLLIGDVHPVSGDTVRLSEATIKGLNYRLPQASPEYNAALSRAHAEAASLRRKALVLQAEISTFNRQMMEAERDVAGCTNCTAGFLRRRSRRFAAFVGSAQRRRDELEQKLKELKEGTETLSASLAVLGGYAVNREGDMARHQQEAPMLRDTLKWLRGLSSSTLYRVPEEAP